MSAYGRAIVSAANQRDPITRAILFERVTEPPGDWIAGRDVDPGLARQVASRPHHALRDAGVKGGYSFLSLSVYGSTFNPLYAAVMVKRSKPIVQHDSPFLKADEFQRAFDAERKKGFGPVILSAMGSRSKPASRSFFEPQKPIPLTRFGLHSGSVDDPDSIQGGEPTGEDRGAHPPLGGVLRLDREPCLCRDLGSQPGEGDLGTPTACSTLPTSYQARFERSALRLEPSGFRYGLAGRTSILAVRRQRDRAMVRHARATPGASTRQQFDDLTTRGFYPICVQGAGSSVSSARYSCIFAKRESPTARDWNPVGPRDERRHRRRRQEGHDGDARPAGIARDREGQEARLRARVYLGRARLAGRPADDAIPHGEPLEGLHRTRDLSADRGGHPLARRHGSEHPQAQDAERGGAGGPPLLAASRSSTCSSTPAASTKGHTRPMCRPSNAFILAQPMKKVDRSRHSRDDRCLHRVRPMWERTPATSSPTTTAATTCSGGSSRRSEARRRRSKRFNDLFAPLGITRIRRARSLVSTQESDEARYRTNVVGDEPDQRLDIATASSVMTHRVT